MRRSVPDLSRWLLSRAVQRLAAGRDRCADCGRTPLESEQVHLYDSGAVVCALCRPAHRGKPVGCHTIRHSELGHAVKPAVPIAA
jgi:hypothetical protein